MRSLATSLGAWDTIETRHKTKHGITFPLAIVSATMADAGFPEPDVWEGESRPEARDYDLLLVSAMDSRHFWRVVPFLREYGIPHRAADRGERDPIVILGGQAATAPAPVEPFVDVVYVGEAEAYLPELLRALDGGGARRQRLERAAAVPGCLVPSLGGTVRQVFADDISITLRERLNVNHREIHRVEIARGCKGPAHSAPKDPTKNAACGFCALGWRAPYRENPAEAIEAALTRTREAGIREIHLSAGDAEGHSEIVALRRAVARLKLRDHGWTGRLDTMRDCSVSAGKQFAFGIEGPSIRLRRAVGKGRLTNDYIVDQVEAYWQAGGRRLMFHLIGGLPSESDADAEEFGDLLDRLALAAPERVHLQIGRQPFGPLPHTPMQWFAPGLTTERIGRVVARHVRGSRLAVLDKSGQTYAAALLNAVAMRGGPEVAPLMEAGPPRLPSSPLAARMRWEGWLRGAGLDPGRYLGAWDPDAPTPWEHVQSAYPRETVRRAYDRTCRQLGLTFS